MQCALEINSYIVSHLMHISPEVISYSSFKFPIVLAYGLLSRVTISSNKLNGNMLKKLNGKIE